MAEFSFLDYLDPSTEKEAWYKGEKAQILESDHLN